MYISLVSIEITRECNLNCDHCLRGEAQSRTISTETIEAIAKSVSRIDSLCITGGEPSLHPEKIREIISIFKKEGVEVGSLDITTNGVEMNIDFFLAVAELYAFCKDKGEDGYSRLCISKDDFHYDQFDDEVDQLYRAFSFYDPDARKNEYGRKGLISEGRAQEYGLVDGRTIDYQPERLYDEEGILNDKQATDTSIHISALGEICLSCDMSYESQAKYNIGNVNETTIHEALCAYVEKIKEEVPA